MSLLRPTVVAALLAAAAAAQAAPVNLRLLGTQDVATGTLFAGVEFGGISGIDRLGNGQYVAIADDRGGERGTPRFYKLSLAYDATGFQGVAIDSQTYMLRPDGTPFPATSRTVDPEGIRVLPSGNLAWSSEGNWNANPASRYQPFVREMTAAGGFVREYSLSPAYNYVDNTTTGGRSNKLFEALAVTPGGALYAANEDALVQDGPITTLAAGSVVRVTAVDTGRQYAYQLPAIPVDAAAGAPFPPDNGMSELLAIDETSFIAVERAFAFGVGNTIRLVRTAINPGTTDVSGIASLASTSYTPMTRELLLEMPISFDGVALDNIEGITWGETLANGNRTLVLVADNNFSATQRTQFLVFEVSAVPEPSTYAAMLGGLGALALLARRRRS